MEKKTTKVWIIVLSIILVLSLLLNIILSFNISYINLEWENDYNKMYTEYCEFTNDYVDFINDLIVELQMYDSFYDDIELYKKADCWS